MRGFLATVVLALTSTAALAAPPLSCEMRNSKTTLTVTGSQVLMLTGDKTRTLPAKPLPQDHSGWPRVWLLQEPPSAHMLLVSAAACVTEDGTFPLSVSLNTLGLGQQRGCCNILK